MKYLLIHTPVLNNPIFAQGFVENVGDAKVIYISQNENVGDMLEGENIQNIEKLEIKGSNTELNEETIEQLSSLVWQSSTLQELIFQYCSPMDKILLAFAEHRSANKHLSNLKTDLKIRFAPKVSEETIEALVEVIKKVPFTSIQLYFDDSFPKNFNWKIFDPLIGALWASSIKKIHLVPQQLQDKLLKNSYHQQQAKVNKELEELNKLSVQRERNKSVTKNPSIKVDKNSALTKEEEKEENQVNVIEMDESKKQSPTKEANLPSQVENNPKNKEYSELNLDITNPKDICIYEAVKLLKSDGKFSFKQFCDFLAINEHVLAVLNNAEKTLGEGFPRTSLHNRVMRIAKDKDDLATEKYFKIAHHHVETNKATQEGKTGIKTFQINLFEPQEKPKAEAPKAEPESSVISLSQVTYFPANKSEEKECIEIIHPNLEAVETILTKFANVLFDEFRKMPEKLKQQEQEKKIKEKLEEKKEEEDIKKPISEKKTDTKTEEGFFARMSQFFKLDTKKEKKIENLKEIPVTKKQILKFIAELVWRLAQASPYIVGNSPVLELAVDSLLTYSGLKRIKMDFNEIRVTALVTNVNNFIEYFVNRCRECYQSVPQDDIDFVNSKIALAVSEFRSVLDNFILSNSTENQSAKNLSVQNSPRFNDDLSVIVSSQILPKPVMTMSDLATKLKNDLYLYDDSNPKNDIKEKTPPDLAFEILKIINNTLNHHSRLGFFQRKSPFEKLLTFARDNLMNTEVLGHLELVPEALKRQQKIEGTEFKDPEIEEIEEFEEFEEVEEVEEGSDEDPAP